jgi:hypothetical protein
MFLPDFLGIGAQRAATTWVHQCLREHPQIFVPACKEIHFFDQNYHKGSAWYASHFRPGIGHRSIGEVTPNYLDHELAAPRMARMLPGARLFVILRDPAERALSAYRFFRHQFQGLSFPEACRKPFLIELGRYAKHLKRIFGYYPREQVKIMLYDDILRDPGLVLRNLYHFLNVNDCFVPPSLPILYNHASLRTVDGTPDSLGWLAHPFKHLPLVRWLRRRLGRQSRCSRCDRISLAVLENLRRVFHEDVLELQELIGRDCSAWLASPCTDSRMTDPNYVRSRERRYAQVGVTTQATASQGQTGTLAVRQTVGSPSSL